MSTFRKGQKVVCVDRHNGAECLDAGKVYEILDVTNDPGCACRVQGVHIGLYNALPWHRCRHCGVIGKGFGPIWFCAWRFRPLIQDRVHEELVEKFVTEEVKERPDLVPQQQ